mgnify:CR=1 FL=1
MRNKELTGLLFAGVMAVALSGCSGASDIEFADTDAAKAAMNHARSIYLEGNYDAVNQKTDILADGKVAGYLNRKTVSINGETWFRYDFVTDEWINEDGDDYIAGNTYGYYDADGNCLGYAQLRSMQQDDEYYYYFMDAEGNLKNYRIEENGYYAWDNDGNVIATGDWHSDFRISFMDDACHVQIDMKDDATTQMDFMDKMVMYILLFDEAEFWLRD